MIKEGIYTNAIYQHHKDGFYKVLNIGYLEETEMPMVIYYRCDINGIYQSIREEYDHNEVIIGQPFIRPLVEFLETLPLRNFTRDEFINIKFATDKDRKNGRIPRFKFVKQL